MLKLWGRISSINVQKVVWCLDELGLAYERIDIGGAFGTTPAYRLMNPNALVPTMEEEDGFTLWESNAIVRYLLARHESPLYPSDPRVRAEADRWMDWQTTTATPALRDAFWQLIRTAPEARNAEALSLSLEASERMARMLDDHLATRDYVAGPSFTMGDIPLACHAHRWLNLPAERPTLPYLEAWYGRVRARPGACTVTALTLS